MLMMICKRCGYGNQWHDERCRKCNHRLSNDPSEESRPTPGDDSAPTIFTVPDTSPSEPTPSEPSQPEPPSFSGGGGDVGGGGASGSWDSSGGGGGGDVGGGGGGGGSE